MSSQSHPIQAMTPAQPRSWQPDAALLNRMVSFAESILGPLSNGDAARRSEINSSLAFGMQGLEPVDRAGRQRLLADSERLGWLLTGQLFRSVLRRQQNAEAPLVWREFLYGYRVGMIFPIAIEDQQHKEVSRLEGELKRSRAGSQGHSHSSLQEDLQRAKAKVKCAPISHELPTPGHHPLEHERDAYEMGLLAYRRKELLLQEVAHLARQNSGTPVKETALQATNTYLEGLHYKPVLGQRHSEEPLFVFGFDRSLSYLRVESIETSRLAQSDCQKILSWIDADEGVAPNFYLGWQRQFHNFCYGAVDTNSAEALLRRAHLTRGLEGLRQTHTAPYNTAHHKEHTLYTLGRGFAVVMHHHKEGRFRYQRANQPMETVTDQQYVPDLPFHLFKFYFIGYIDFHAKPPGHFGVRPPPWHTHDEYKAFATGEALRMIQKEHAAVCQNGDHVALLLDYFLGCLTTRQDWAPTVQARTLARTVPPNQNSQLYEVMRVYADNYKALFSTERMVMESSPARPADHVYDIGLLEGRRRYSCRFCALDQRANVMGRHIDSQRNLKRYFLASLSPVEMPHVCCLRIMGVILEEVCTPVRDQGARIKHVRCLNPVCAKESFPIQHEAKDRDAPHGDYTRHFYAKTDGTNEENMLTDCYYATMALGGRKAMQILLNRQRTEFGR